MNTNNKIILWVIGVLIVVALAFIYFTSDKSGSDDIGTDLDDGNAIACTMDAKMCPDGSYVGRSGPKCEFTPCPTVSTSTSGVSGNTSDPVTYPTNSPADIGK